MTDKIEPRDTILFQLKLFCNWMKGFFPITSKNHDTIIKNMQDSHQRHISNLIESHKSELDSAKQDVAKIVERSSKITFVRYPEKEEYAIQIRFEPRMWGYGFWETPQINMLADYLGRRVECEVRSLRFIQNARVQYIHDPEQYHPEFNATAIADSRQFTKPQKREK